MTRKILFALLCIATTLVVSSGPADAQSCGGTVANFGSSSNVSNGTANVTTGSASSTGNQSSSSSSQSSTGGGGVGTTRQQTSITNNGSASANTGGNRVIGNNSRNVAITEQEITCEDYVLNSDGVEDDALDADTVGRARFRAEGAASRLGALRLSGADRIPSTDGETDVSMLPLVGVAAALVIVHLSLAGLLRQRSAARFAY